MARSELVGRQEGHGSTRQPFNKREFDADFARDIGKTGWIGLGWPKEFGGQARSPLEQIAFMETMEQAEAPRIGASIQANALMMFGTPAQQQKYLPEILRGEAMHGMGYSEPQAGSDLAALRTSAVQDGDHWVINGQKIWTTTWWGKYMFLAARTDKNAKPPHAGISMFIVPMNAPGITIQPASTMYDGSFANIFYDDVRIPLENIVGEVNGGWKVLTGALAFERGLVGGGIVLKVAHAFEQLRRHVMAAEGDRPSPGQRPDRSRQDGDAGVRNRGWPAIDDALRRTCGRRCDAAGIWRDQQGLFRRTDGTLRRGGARHSRDARRRFRADAGRDRQWPVRAEPAAFADVGDQHRDQRDTAQPDRPARAGVAEIGADSMQDQTSTSPLEGVRVLDFSIMLAGPYCARLLADVGAEVIKIEPPEGDEMRLRAPVRDGHSAYFGQLNAGKRSIALDLKSSDAIKLVHRMVENTDILVENFRPGVMERLGLGYETLRKINPRLIYCSISGYGQTGPQAERAAYAMIVHAESGFDRALMRYAGDRDRPAAGAVFVADILGGIFGFSAIQTAMVQRARTGEGQRIDVALMDCMMNLLVYELQEAQFSKPMPRPTYGPVRARDGDILIAPVSARNFAALRDLTGLPELSSDPRFASVPARGANWTAMMQVIEKWTMQHTMDECLAMLDQAGIPSARFRDPAEALGDPDLADRGTFAPIADAAGEFKGVNAPWRMSGAHSAIGAGNSVHWIAPRRRPRTRARTVRG